MELKVRITIQKVLPYTFTWFIGALVYIILEKGVLVDSLYYPTTNLAYSFEKGLRIILPLALLGGTLMGLIEVFLVKRVFQGFSFGGKIVIKALFYMLIMVLILSTISFINNSTNLNKPFWNTQVVNEVYLFFQSVTFWSIMIYGVFLTAVVQFFSEVSDSLGYHQLKNFFIGTYHSPQEEERIFMFLDIKGSTTMAEQLGHKNYFRLIQQFFADISGPITASWGEIYQYVGDEVVVSWPKNHGLKNGNCINCFFESQKRISLASSKYLSTFNMVPEFKAGIHMGKVAIGEVGSMKRDILFSGDVLNTTSRIQAKCNEFGVSLIVSEELLESISLNNDEFVSKKLGAVDLRGKNTKVNLFSLHKCN